MHVYRRSWPEVVNLLLHIYASEIVDVLYCLLLILHVDYLITALSLLFPLVLFEINQHKVDERELITAYLFLLLLVELKKQSTCTIRLANNSHEHVAFKVKYPII